MRRAIPLLLLLLAAPACAAVVRIPYIPADEPSLSTPSADTIYLSPTTYAAGIAPASGGTEERPKVWIGAGANTVVPSVTPKSHCRFYNMTVTAAVDMPANGKHVMFDGCTLGGLNFKDADSSSVRNCTVKGSYYRVNGDCSGAVGSSASYDTLEGCSFPYLNCSDSKAQLYGCTSPRNYVDHFVRRFNTFTVTQSGTAAHSIAKHFQCSYLVSYGNTWTITSTATSGGAGEPEFGFVYRDSSYNLTMRRDIIYINNESGNVDHKGLLFLDGQGGAYATSNTNDTVDSCYIRIFRGSAVYFGASAQGMKMRYNVFRSRVGTGIEIGSAFTGGSSDPYIHHNTVMGKQAVNFGAPASTNEGGRISANLFWGTNSGTCDDWAAVAGGQGNSTAISDSNVVYSTTLDSTRSFSRSTCGTPRTGQWSTVYSNDQHSYWSNPQFTDTTWATLNVKPATAFVIGSNSFTLGYAGASAGGATTIPQGSTSVVAPPETVTQSPVGGSGFGVDDYFEQSYFVRERR